MGDKLQINIDKCNLQKFLGDDAEAVRQRRQDEGELDVAASGLNQDNTRRQSRWHRAENAYEGIRFVHHDFVNIAKIVKIGTSDSSLSDISKRYLAREVSCFRISKS